MSSCTCEDAEMHAEMAAAAEMRRCGNAKIWMRRCGCGDVDAEMHAEMHAEMRKRRCGSGVADADVEMRICGGGDAEMRICGYADAEMRCGCGDAEIRRCGHADADHRMRICGYAGMRMRRCWKCISAYPHPHCCIRMRAHRISTCAPAHPEMRCGDVVAEMRKCGDAEMRRCG